MKGEEERNLSWAGRGGGGAEWDVGGRDKGCESYQLHLGQSGDGVGTSVQQ